MAISLLTLLVLWTSSVVKADIIQCMNDKCTIFTNDTLLNAADPSFQKFSKTYLQQKVTVVRFDTPKLKEFSSAVLGKFANLTDLQVSQTAIESIQALPNSGNLKKINISWNRMINLTNTPFVNATACTHLLLSHNVLNVVDAEAFEGLQSLKILKLDHNQLSTLPSDVFEPLKKLKFLRLDCNQFVTLDTRLFVPTQRLTDLNLGSNPLKQITKPQYEVTIESLKLDNTTLLDIRNLTAFNRLSNLHLSNNPHLRVEGGTFARMSNIRELFLSGMTMNRMAGNFTCLTPLQKLRYLELDDNNLGTLDLEEFPRLSHLRTLSLNNNNLSRLAYTWLTKVNFPALTRIYISQNQWNCSFLDEMRIHLSNFRIEIGTKVGTSQAIECVGSPIKLPMIVIVVPSLCLIIVVLVLVLGIVCCRRQKRDKQKDDHTYNEIDMGEFNKDKPNNNLYSNNYTYA